MLRRSISLTVRVRQVAQFISLQLNPNRHGGEVVAEYKRTFSRGRNIRTATA